MITNTAVGGSGLLSRPFHTLAALSLLLSLATAHGANPAAELAARAEFDRTNTVNLAHCAEKLKRDGVIDRAVQRRSSAAAAEAHRQLRRREASLVEVRDIREVLQTDHQDDSVSLESTQKDIFATRDDGCVLMPEVTEGPFYVEGELVRHDLHDDEPGLGLYLDFQIIDTETCEPVPDIYVEVWHTNATGIYSGVPLNGDPGNAQTTFGRGLALTDDDGAAWFATNFPGHYGGRTPHVHIAAHRPDTAALANGTVQNSVVAHNGQLYFDQQLVDAVRSTEHYRGNFQPFVRNAEDVFFQQAAAVSDPVMSYFVFDTEDDGVEEVNKGVFAWKLVGVNMNNARKLSVAGTLLPDME